jgi:acyl transferase domain-containing protein
VSRLEDADCFDAAFFGYSPKEAAVMNPQGRVFLECVWHAMENAGYCPTDFPGAIGLYASESLSTYLVHNVYGHMDHEDFVLGPANIQAFIGNSQDFVATRVSYKLNLRGPSLTVQTACSSSLTAVHLARQALLNGECEMAIAGGVSIYLPQDRGYRYQDGLILSPDGHCRPFDANARGIVFGRGAGAVVLKPLLRALEDGDHVRAVIRGSAANNDGAQKVGYTAPSVAGQARVIREALADADVGAETISYIEAHGTGTPQGDPIEIAALTEAYQKPGTRAGHCAIGSVKGNIGHLDVAAGVTSFIKTVLMLEHRQLAPSINFSRGNPDIDFAASPFRVNTTLRPWEPTRGPRRAGVSAFGFGGTNVHVILEEAPAPARGVPGGAPGHVLRLSARSEAALDQLSERFADYLATASEPLQDICHSANTGRAGFAHRLVARAARAEGLQEALAAAATGTPHVGYVRGHADVTAPPPIAFLFTGLGAQYAGMGRQLYDTQPVFREALEECEVLLRPELELPLLRVLYPGPGESTPIDETAYGQPTMFAFEYALARLWDSWGIRPAAVLGHSLGEYAAACIAGLLPLPDAIRLVAQRARLMQSLPPGGAMAAVFAREDQVVHILASEAGLVSIASFNSPENLVLSGEAAAVQRVADRLTAQQIEVRMLNVSRAFHSALLDPVLDEFERVVAQASFARAEIPIVSNVTGRLLTETEGRDPRYWRRHAREPVRFAEGIRTLHARGIRQFVEIGPHTTASGMAAGSLPDDVLCIPSLRKGREDWDQMFETLGELYVRGAEVDWSGVGGPSRTRRKVPLPQYPFARTRHWMDAPPASTSSALPGQPLLARAIRSPLFRDRAYEVRIGLRAHPFVGDHRIHGSALFPATCFAEAAREAARDAFGWADVLVEDLAITDALTVPDAGERLGQVVLTPDGGSCRFEVFALPVDASGEAAWRSYATGMVTPGTNHQAPAAPVPLEAIRARSRMDQDGATFYRDLASRGFVYGPAFQGIVHVWHGAGEMLSELQLPETLSASAGQYAMHPAFLDAGLQAVLALVPEGESYLPTLLASVQTGPVPHRLFAHAVRRNGSSGVGAVTCDVHLANERGDVVGQVLGIELRSVDRRWAAGGGTDVDSWLYEAAWRPAALPTGASAHDLPAAAALAGHLRNRLPGVLELHDMAEYGTVQSQLDQVCGAFAWRAFASLGWRVAPGAAFTTDELCEDLGIVPTHRRLAGRLLEMLAEDGVLAQGVNGWTFLREPRSSGTGTATAALGAGHPRLTKMLEMVDRCGSALAPVLAGQRDPLELLFPGGSLRDIEALYRRSPFTEAYNALVRDGITELVRSLPPDRVLRVLEIGAGTGSTSASVLPALPAERTRYLFTDISPLFLAQAQETFRDFPFVEYQTLDAERDPLAQGLKAGAFDLVIASNVLHATTDLRRTLAHVRTTLAPGGLILLVEGVARQRWVDLIFGMTEGWWKYSDRQLRHDYPLLSQAEWQRLLETSGFDGVASIPGDARPEALFHQAIILARRTGQGSVSDAPADDGAPRWLVVGARTPVIDGAVARLRDAGVAVEMLAAATDEPDGLARAIAGAGEARPIDAVLFGAPGFTAPDAAPAVVADLLHVVQALAADAATSAARLWIVTTGAQAVVPGDDAGDVFASPLWGLAQVVTLEHPELRCTCVDVDAEAADADHLLAQELLGDGPEPRVAHRAGARFVSRLARPEPRRQPGLRATSSRRLVAADPGVLDSLTYVESPRVAPAAGQVEIRVRATGLNFKDLLSALGTYPGDAGELGNECAGEVIALGPGVSSFTVGDEVVAFAPGSFADIVIADERLVARKPANISFEAAATIAGGFLTAHHALHHLAMIGPSDTVLIHAATGGVGLAAVQLARRAGATVIASAGSDTKRQWLASMGIRHRFSSRSTGFADATRQATDGRGVDVVLNSLAGDMIDATASVLREGGRFVELGKVNRPSGALVQRMKYFNPDVAEECRRDPGRFGGVLREIMEAVARGELAPLPVHAFAERDTIAAFRFMARARHIGKIVVRRDGMGTAPPAIPIRADASYLVVGGAGGLGLLVARHLAARGARHLALMARRAPGAAEQEAIDQLIRDGVRVLVLQGDVARPEDVAAVMARVSRELPPLRGVIQSAGVLDDGVLQQQSLARFAGVMAPKVAGTWNVHNATRHLPLDLFVMFSSVASFLGSPGQGNHAAANAFLDAFASYRRARGLAGLTINWGAWSDIGAAARRQIGGRIAMRGLGEIAPADGIVAFDRVLEWAEAQVAVVPIDWQVYGRQFATGHVPPFLADVLAQSEKRAPAARAPQPVVASFVSQVRAAAPSEQPVMVTAMIREHVGRGLGLSAAEAINPHQPLGALGLDSLLAVELRNALSRALALSRPLPATLLFDYPTIAGLAEYIMATVIGEPPVAAASSSPAPSLDFEDVAALSDAEAEALLLQELE